MPDMVVIREVRVGKSHDPNLHHLSANAPRDGLVYSIMANIRGQTEFGPECFYSAISSEDESDENSTGRRDIRDLVPLRLNRSSLQASARDIKLRLEFLCKSVAHTADYEAVLSLVEIAEKLAAMPSENPKLSLREYGDIWTTIRDGVAAANDMPLQVVSINEQDELRRVKWNAECCWGVAVLNAAMRGLDGSKIEQLVDDSEERRVTFGGDLRTMSYKINGLLLDSKDFFPEGERWFTREQEELILEAVVRVYAEAEKRRHM